MNSVSVVAGVFQRFKYKESSIHLKLKELEKQLISCDYVTSCLNCEVKRNKLTNKKMEILERDNAVSRNVTFMKELNVAETQLRLMACFCPTENYLQACKSKFTKLEAAA